MSVHLERPRLRPLEGFGSGAPCPDRPVQKAAAVPPADWPAWATSLRLSRKLQTMLKLPGHEAAALDKGVGDTVARLVGPFGGEAFKAWAAEQGVDCGCNVRQEELNAKYPYKDGPTL